MGYATVSDAAGKAVTLDRAQELYDFLQGADIAGIRPAGRPRLSRAAAYAVIYVLQEHMNLLPDHFEKCCRCGEMYDDHHGGKYAEKTGRHYCNDCA